MSAPFTPDPKDSEPLLIRAGAGTGKTYRLSNRLIALLCAGEQPERILATTFTRKAAGEIFERVLLRLAEGCLTESGAKELSSALGQHVEADYFGKILQRVTERQHRVSICTLDSFFMKIARGFSFELGLSPSWDMLDERETEELREEAIRRVIEQDPERLRGLLVAVLGGSNKRSIYSEVMNNAQSLHSVFLQTEARNWIWPKTRGFLSRNERELRLRELQKLPIPQTKQGKPNSLWEKNVAALIKAFERSDWDSFLEAGLVKKVLANELTFAKANISSEWARRISTLAGHAAQRLTNRLRRRTLAVYRMLDLFNREFAGLKAKRGAFEFGDVTYFLARAHLLRDLEHMYFRLDTRIRHLLLDEFQDTSGDQWAILQPLADEILAQADLERSFFCVGDVKQAIYGWRGGRAEIFDYLEEKYPQLTAEHLTESYRSSPIILETVNRVFEKISENPALEKHTAAARHWQHGYKEHSSAKTELPGYSALIAVSKDAEEENDACLEEAVRLVERLSTGAPNASIGILLRTNNKVSALVSQLRARGIPASQEGGNPLSDSPGVALILTALHFADHPGDRLSRFNLLCSPLGKHLGLSSLDDNRKAVTAAWHVRRRILTEGYGKVISSWAEVLSAELTERDNRRLQQLIELGELFGLRTGARTEDFCRFIKKKKVEDVSSSRVRVMTIHQSKGLEFDAVILPELTACFGGLQDGPVVTDNKHPLSPPERVVSCPRMSLRAANSQLDAAYSKYKSGLVAESLSVLYVALTRAVHALYMLVPEKSRYANQYSKALVHALRENDEDSSGILYENGNPNWYAGLPAAPPESSTSSKRKLVLAPQPAQRRRSLERRSPSGLEGLNSDTRLAQLLRLHSQTGIQRGTALHSLFEEITWLDDGPPEQAELLKRALQLGAEPTAAETLVKEFLTCLNNEIISGRLQRAHYSDRAERLEVFTEHTFAMREGNTVLSGSLDRMVVGYNNDRPCFAHVLDFKTDRPSSEEDYQARVEHYRPQLAAYRRAAAHLTGLAPDKIEAELLFTTVGSVFRLEEQSAVL